MEKLVITTYYVFVGKYSDDVRCLFYASKDSLIRDMERLEQLAIKNKKTCFNLLGCSYHVRYEDSHCSSGWTIYTLDEYFENNRVDK